MKKKIALALSLGLTLSMLVGCGSKDANNNNQGANVENNQNVGNADSLKTGLGIITTTGSSRDADGEDNGNAQVDSVIAAVTVDSNGKIVDCIIDSAQTKIAFTSKGAIDTDLDATVKTKLELGADYGMVKASSIGKEWNEQAQSLADYFVGKTVEEIKGIARDEKGVATDADLTSSVTIKINGYINAVEKAVANAKEIGTKANDKLSLAVETSISDSRDAEDDTDGKAQAYSTYSVITTDADGKITGCILDASQGTVTFDAEGVITSDIDEETKSKTELGDDYGMKKASAIGKEWFEQANAFEQYVIGKSLNEVEGIQLENKKATDSDLTSSCTIKVNGFIAALKKAFAAI